MTKVRGKVFLIGSLLVIGSLLTAGHWAAGAEASAAGFLDPGVASASPRTVAATNPATRPQDKNLHQYKGAATPIADACTASTYVVVAEIVDPGGMSADAPGEIYHESIQLKIIESFKGSAADKLSVNMILKSFPLDEADIVPVKGMKAIFFISDKLLVLKMAPDDAATVKEVKAALGKLPGDRP